MKRILTFLTFLSVCLVNAQSFNYQAIVRDTGGNPVTNQAIGVRVSLERASANIYQETHTVTSDANGLINFAVGTGTNTGFPAFSTIDWSTQDFNMILDVDITGGTTYVNIGTTFLRQVPYALYAASAPSTNYFTLDNNVLRNVAEAADPNNNRFNDFVIGSHSLESSPSFDSKMFFDVSKGAFRAGTLLTSSPQWNDVNRGNFSTAFGYNTLASGVSTFASGFNSNASGAYSFAHGQTTRASGDHSVAIGNNLSPRTYGETHLGVFSTGVAGSVTTIVPTERLFVIGNGTGSDVGLTRDALVMLKNGNTTLNGQLTIDGDNQGAGTAYTLPGQDGAINQVMSTDGSGNLTWVSPSSSSLPNGGNNGNVLSTDGSGNYAWVNNDVLPAGGTTGEVLSTDGSGNYSWVSGNDADADATNEIELPTGGTNGQVLATDGSGVYSWTDQPSVAAGAFSTTANVTSNASGNIATDDFVFGGTSLSNLAGSDDNHRMFFDKSLAAFRAGRTLANQWDNVGLGSVAIGLENIASGFSAVSLGQDNTASGSNATALGNNNTVSGVASVVMGQNNTVSGVNATAIGRNLTSESYGQTTIGLYNTAFPGTSFPYVATDRLFVVGNGESFANKSDALIMLKNGNTTLNGQLTIDGDNTGAGASYTLPAQDGTANYVMTTDGAGNATWQAASGGGTTLPNGGTNGDVLSTDGTGNYSWINNNELPTGGTNGQLLATDGSGTYSWTNAAAAGAFSTTANITSNASGDIAADNFVFGSSQLDDDTATTNDNNRMLFFKAKGAFRAGFLNTASKYSAWDNANVGPGSVALGVDGIASGFGSVAIGNGNTASGTSAIAMGENATVSGRGALSFGINTTSETYAQTTLGTFNTLGIGNSDSFDPVNRLFVIGNGEDTANKSDALVMLKNGNTTLNGQLTIDGDNTGVGASYTLPAQDGTASQVMTTDGAGNTSWTTVASGAMLPAGGTNGDQLTTNGAGVYSWTADAVNDADSDPANEIELPTGGNANDILRTNGSGVYSWAADAVNDADSDPTNEIELPTGGTVGQVLKSDGAGGSTWSSDIEATSVKITALPAFNVTANATTFNSAGPKEINNWTTGPSTDLFNDGGHMSVASGMNLGTGRFTAPVDGLYFFSSQVRIDGLDVAGSYSRLMIVKNNVVNYRNGLHSIRHENSGTSAWDTQSVSGILKLNASDTVSVYIETFGDPNFVLQIESGFNGYLVNKL